MTLAENDDVVQGHSTNQFPHLLCNRRPATLVTTLPCPVVLEDSSVPSDYSRRLDEDEAVSPSGPGAGEPEPEDTVSLQQAWASIPPAENDQLLAKG